MCVDRIVAATGDRVARAPGHLLLVAARHPVSTLGVSAYPDSVTDDVLGEVGIGNTTVAAALAAALLDLPVLTIA